MSKRINIKLVPRNTLAAYGLLWLLVESFLGLFTTTTIDKGMVFWILLAISLIYGTCSSLKTNRVVIEKKFCDSKLEIIYGDIFDPSHFNGYIAIGVNEFFDSKVNGTNVSEKSLHGQLIKNIMGNNFVEFERVVQESLSGVGFDTIQRQNGPSKKYDIGTTAAIEHNGKRFFLVSLAHTDINTLKASIKPSELYSGINTFWKHARNKSNGYPIYIPLFGSGLSGVDLPKKDMIAATIDSYFISCTDGRIADKVTLVLPLSFKDEIDLREFK